MHECINIELKTGDKPCYFIALYGSPSQSQDEFERLSEKLKLNLESPKKSLLVELTGDFHAKSKNWYKNIKCSFEENIIENVTLQFGLQQVMKEP